MQPVIRSFNTPDGVSLDGQQGNPVRLVGFNEVNVFTAANEKPAGILVDVDGDEPGALASVLTHGPAHVVVGPGAWDPNDLRFSIVDNKAVPLEAGRYSMGELSAESTPVEGRPHNCFISISPTLAA